MTLQGAMRLGEAMQQMVQEGKVRFLGITAWDGHPDVTEPVLSSGVYHTAQILYNMLNRTAASEPPAAFDDVNQGLSLAVAQRNDIGDIIGVVHCPTWPLLRTTRTALAPAFLMLAKDEV